MLFMKRPKNEYTTLTKLLRVCFSLTSTTLQNDRDSFILKYLATTVKNKKNHEIKAPDRQIQVVYKPTIINEPNNES